MSIETPMMRQYLDIKSAYKDSILFFRLGDFYEMFFDDAKVASKELSLTLTGRGKDDNRVPMCGIPFHAAEGYISKLVQKGYKVAVCEQVEPAEQSKGPTKRDVVRIITPGTVQLNNVLVESDCNYLAAINKSKGKYGIAYLDISTGEFKCDVLPSYDIAISELQRLGPKELLIDDSLSKIDIPFKQAVPFFPYQIKQAREYLETYFGVKDLSVFQINDLDLSYPAIVGILEYVEFTQKGRVAQINTCQPAKIDEGCRINQGVLNHLDLFSKGGLYDFMNLTKTAMGARLLRQWIRYPLMDKFKIEARHNRVEYLIENNDQYEKICSCIEPINDIERLLSKICSRYDNPKDLLTLRDSLNEFPTILDYVNQYNDQFKTERLELLAICSEDDSIIELINTLNAALLEDVPTHTRDGAIFRSGYSTELDDLCQSFSDVRTWIKDLEPKSREAYDIKSLKVGFNKVFGYYIEIPNSQKDKVPSHFVRKQTLANAERYITPELKDKETILLNAKEQQIEIEKRLYQNLIECVQKHVSKIQVFSGVIAQLDVTQSLSGLASKYQLVKPVIADSDFQLIDIDNLWHPMVSQSQQGKFIKNDIKMGDNGNIFLITGPNMAGKSTLMRSIAIAVIMTQMGSFIPASSASLSLVDQLFTRIGANDKLSEGQSTFMVEMIETAEICNNATQDSLILLDEVGRGTSTFDGVSIAAAVTEYLATEIKARTLFATHYHELTVLAEKYPQIKNVSMEISEINQKLVFSYKLVSGSAKKSYGVKVAKMAGLPESITEKAQQWLDKFEEDINSSTHIQLSLF